MNLAQAQIVLRPRTLGETLDLALRWQISVGGGTYLRLSLGLLLPAALGCFALHRGADWAWREVWWLAIALTTVLHGVFTVAASQMMFEPEVTARAVLRTFARRLPTFIGALIVSRIYLGVAMLVLVLVPWAWPRTLYIHEAVLLEQQPVMAAMRRSIAFAKGHYGRLIGLLFASVTAMLVGVFIVESAAAAVFDFVLQMERPWGALADGGSLAALLGLFAAVPFVASAQFLYYIDARTRRDGWDIQLAFMAIDDEGEDAR
ncbi:MAG: hypothetical protein AAF799_13465 [Myxococcota bacterium]